MVAESLGWAMRMVFAAVFVSSAIGKLTAREVAREAVAAFGIPASWVPMVAWALPITELLVALGLLVPVTALAAAVIGLGLLAIFTALVGAHLLRGNHPSCACFGAADLRPIDSRTVVRNTALMLIGAATVGAAVAFPQLPAPLSADRTALISGGVALAAVQMWQGLALRKLGQHRSASATPTNRVLIGSRAPEFELPASPGTPSSLAGLLASGRPQVLVFMRQGCGPCAQVATELPDWHRRLDGRLDITVLGSGTLQDNAVWAEKYGVTRYLVQHYNEVAERYGVRGTPTAVRIGIDGRIASAPATGLEAIRTLLDQ